MGWATPYIQKLQAGETVSFRPRGASMKGRIESGQLCAVKPVDVATLSAGDIALCKVRGHEYLHIVKAIIAVSGLPYPKGIHSSLSLIHI